MVMYATQLHTLEQMGFTITPSVLQLVKKHKGNVNNAVGELLSLQ